MFDLLSRSTVSFREGKREESRRVKAKAGVTGHIKGKQSSDIKSVLGTRTVISAKGKEDIKK